jgi:hypothetical protein
VREGEQVIELPVIKAVFRAMGVSAMKGNRLSQVAMAELVRGVEDEDRKLRSDHFEAACEYKTGWERAIEHARSLGRPEPEPIPHPDDIILNFRDATVTYDGPMTNEHKQAYDHAVAYRQDLQDEINYWAKRYPKERDPQKKRRQLEMWHHSQGLYDRINSTLGARYRKRLENRSYTPGAPQEGLGNDVQLLRLERAKQRED